MTEYIEKGDVRNQINNCIRYDWNSPISSERHVTISRNEIHHRIDKIPAAEVAPVRHGK